MVPKHQTTDPIGLEGTILQCSVHASYVQIHDNPSIDFRDQPVRVSQNFISKTDASQCNGAGETTNEMGRLDSCIMRVHIVPFHINIRV